MTINPANNSIDAFAQSSTLNAITTPVTVFQGTPLNNPGGLAINPINGDALVVNLNDNNLLEINMTTATVVGIKTVDPLVVDGQGNNSALFGVLAIKDNNGNLKVSNPLAISTKLWYIACMSKQNTVEPSDEQQKTRERIIAATSKVLAEKGYDATTLREISREAQIAPGLVHYYFGGKDQLLVEVLQAAGHSFHQRLAQLVQNMPADQSLEAVLTQIHERVDQEPEVYRLRYESFSLGLHNPLIEPKVRERLAQRRQEIGSVMAKILENPTETEDVQSSPPDLTPLAAVLLSIFDGLALQKIMDPTFDLDAAYQVLARMLHALQSSG